MTGLSVDLSEAVEAVSLALWAADPVRFTSGGWSAVECEPVGTHSAELTLRHRSGIEHKITLSTR